jgi:hypothetical protein
VFLLGAGAGRDFLEEMPGVAGVLIGLGGEVTCVGRLEVEHE